MGISEMLAKHDLTWDDISRIQIHNKLNGDGTYEIERHEWMQPERDYVLISSQLIEGCETATVLAYYNVSIVDDDGDTYLGKRGIDNDTL